MLWANGKTSKLVMEVSARAIPINIAVPFEELGRVNCTVSEPLRAVDPEEEYVEFRTAM